LKEIAPRVKRVVAMFNPASSFAVRFFASAQEAAPKLEVEMVASHVQGPADIEPALARLGSADVGLMLPPDGFTAAYRSRYRRRAIASPDRRNRSL
jgi:ABC-type uncharacterized transport system substrate-binding protein